jgi:hypothetical protein
MTAAGLELNLGPILEANFANRDAGKAPVRLNEAAQRIMKMAPNAIEWCVSYEYVNAPDLYQFQRSYEIIRNYFELRCPVCNPGGIEPGQPGDCWGRSRTYLESEVLLVWDQDNLEDTCPKCGITRSELIEDGFFEGNNQLHVAAGKRSGKSITAALIATYFEHVWLVLGHTYPGGIHGYFGITPAEQFEMTFLASTEVAGQDTVWAKYTGYRRNAPWFHQYVSWVGDEEKNQLPPARKMKPWRYSEESKRITNEHPNIRLVIANLTSNSSGQVGRTRVHGIVDELDYLMEGESRISATEVYRTIEGQLHTIRSSAKLNGCMPWFGSMISLSSPRSRTGKTLELYRQSDEIPGMYARHYATWDFNPREPRENFELDFKKDPIGAARDFGADPPGAEFPLVHDEARWTAITIDKALRPRARFEYFYRNDPLGQRYIGVRLKNADRMFDRRVGRQVVFDAGKNFDCFTGICGHGEWRLTEEREERLATVIDWVFRIVPEQGLEVWFDSVFDLMVELKKFQFTSFAWFDHWNSVQLIQKIRDLGIPAEQEALSNQDFLDWNVNCFEGRMKMLPPAAEDVKTDADGSWRVPFEWTKAQNLLQPESAIISELVELQCDPDTKKVHNPHKGEVRGQHSDDLARIVVHLHRNIQRAGYTDKFDDRSVRSARRRAEHGGSTWGNGRGQLVRVSGGSPRNWSKGRGW